MKSQAICKAIDKKGYQIKENINIKPGSSNLTKF